MAEDGCSPFPSKLPQAVHWAIDELKASVPIWKREWFEDGSQWKENEESRRLLLPLAGAAAIVSASSAEVPQ